MDGRIKMFNEEKGYGFILGVDSNDYFFHISQVKSVSNLSRGTFVHFTPSSGSKGLIALEITPKESSQKHPTFIACGDVRIKLSNIKSYGISEGYQHFIKVYEHSLPKESSSLKLLLHDELVWNGLKIPCSSLYTLRYRYVKDWDGKIAESYQAARDGDCLKQSIHYLYITTYQGDNYRFNDWEVSFDIYEKCRELDSYMQ